MPAVFCRIIGKRGLTADIMGNPETCAAVTYAGRSLALLTRHGKERVVAPVLEREIRCLVEHVDGFDTDRLGTFTRDVPRAGTQVEAARRKALIGMELSGLLHGLGSEGAFGPDPFAGFSPWNVELLLFIDAERNLEVMGWAQGSANHLHALASDWPAVVRFANQTGFPAQHLVVRPEGDGHPGVRRGISAWDDLEREFYLARGVSPNRQVFVETDSRAFCNPTRMGMILNAAANLAERLRSNCPACGAPGFWHIESIPGLRCEACGMPTRETRCNVFGCVKCPHRHTRERTDRKFAEPKWCGFCNP